MSDESKPRRLWGAFRNAVVWGVTWGALGTVISALFRLSDNIPFRIGVVGALTGATFATFISLAYRGKRLADISWKKFGIGGAVLAGAFVPAWMQTLNLLSGDGFAPFSLINGDIVMAAAFGGITAAGTILLAKRDEARNPSALMEDPPTLIEAGMPSSGYAQETRSHSAATEHRE
jgi:hypothetical protein